jgi:antitoxin YefM
MLSLEEYNSLAETAYLLRSPKNAVRIFEAISELDRGSGAERMLIK